MTEMISFGAGVNSVAMTIMLVNDGWQGPIVFADPGAEHPDTYCYIGMFEREWLRPRGLEVTTISPLTHPDLYPPSYRMTLKEKCNLKSIAPIVLNPWCSKEYKAGPLTRWAKANGIQTQNIGITWEERHRARFSRRFGLIIEHPLVDRTINRDMCKRIIRKAGLSVPPKSGCWFCPNQSRASWRMLYDLRPDLFLEAVMIDDAACDKSGYPAQLGISFNMRLSEVGRMWDAQLELPLMPEREYEHAMMCECRL